MNLTGLPRSLRGTYRSSALVVALLLCAAPILGALHASVEAHRYCVEHGIVEEAAAVVAPTPSPESGPGATGDDARAAHEGCAFGQFCRFGQVLAQLILTVAPAPALPAFAAETVAAPVRPIAIFVLAPKNSPPV